MSKEAAPQMNGEVHVGLDAADFLAVFPLKAEGRARLVGTVRDEAGEQHQNLSWDDVSKRVIEWMNIDVERVNWFSTYRVHHRVAAHFRKGCAFLLGDAGHIHSPVGGQGMNTGIGDAVNLAWKLAAVLQRRANPSLLETYEPERIAFARRLVKTTDQAFTGVTSRGAIARRLRLNVVPLLVPTLFALKTMRRLLFRTVSQTAVNYRGSSLSEGRTGAVHGGDQLPWVKTNPRRRRRRQLQAADITGLAGPCLWRCRAFEIRQVCAERKLPLHVFRWRAEAHRAGLQPNAVYLVRPDGYVGLVGPDGKGSSAAIASYLDARELM